MPGKWFCWNHLFFHKKTCLELHMKFLCDVGGSFLFSYEDDVLQLKIVSNIFCLLWNHVFAAAYMWRCFHVWYQHLFGNLIGLMLFCPWGYAFPIWFFNFPFENDFHMKSLVFCTKSCLAFDMKYCFMWNVFQVVPADCSFCFYKKLKYANKNCFKWFLTSTRFHMKDFVPVFSYGIAKCKYQPDSVGQK